MEFRYRYVNFGTTFTAASGNRKQAPQGPQDSAYLRDMAQLYENELAVDVGGVCLGVDGCDLAVLDHHFHRERGQYPAAAAAVLHNAERIFQRFRDATGPIWLVTHVAPDFDALSSLYLARGVLQGTQSDAPWFIPHEKWSEQGLAADGWRLGGQRNEIDWFQPQVAGVTSDRRWAILLAAMASCVDQCKPVGCPKNRTLDGLLYAALQRGRDLLGNGAAEFFDVVRERLQRAPLLNPLFDSVLEDSPEYAPELGMLDRELMAYRQDIRRARRTVVYVRKAAKPFHEWYPPLVSKPLLTPELKPGAEHLTPAGDECVQVDAVFLRDPECLLFKNWSRVDRENSSLGQGFTFTAIAYSGELRTAVTNSTLYFFSLDPEYAIPERLHLYNVWASLEAAELAALLTSSAAQPLRDSDQHATAKCRLNFEARAGEYGSFCDDPWFDGGNYSSTIVVTPSRGTFIGSPGTDADLSDDPVVRLVSEQVEAAALPGAVQILDLSTTSALAKTLQLPSIQAAFHDVPALATQTYRYGQLQLAEGVDPTAGRTGEQIGRMLWQLLHARQRGVPTDFVARHLLITPDSVSVWSRAGIVTAVNARASDSAKELEQKLRELIALASAAGQLAKSEPKTDHELQAAITQADSLGRQLATLQQYLAYPEGRLLRRFYEATKLNEVVSSVRDMHVNQSNALMTRRFDANLGYVAGVQNAIEWLEIFIVSFYSVEMTHILAESLSFEHWYTGAGVIVIGIITSVVMAFALKPWAHGTSDHGDEHAAAGHSTSAFNIHPLARALLVLALLLTIFVGLGLAKFVHHKDEHDKTHGSEHKVEAEHAAKANHNADTEHKAETEHNLDTKAEHRVQLPASTDSPMTPKPPASEESAAK